MKVSNGSRKILNQVPEDSGEPVLLVTNVRSLSEGKKPEKSKILPRKSQRQALKESKTTANRLVTETAISKPEEDSNLDSGEENQNVPIKLGAQKYGCPFCTKITQNCSHMKQHILSHTGEQPFTCDNCGKSFNNKSHLKRHIMLLHTESDERPFACNDCNKSFKLKHHLEEHVVVHTGGKPFSCDTCGQSFKYRKSLKHHLMSNNHSQI